MGALKRFFSIEKWTYKELLLFVAAFLVLNLLAPRGFVQWLLIQQDLRRVRSEKSEIQTRLVDLEDEIRIFQHSDLIKEQKLRELGYLKEGEISLEFIDGSRKNGSHEALQAKAKAQLSENRTR